MAFPVAINANSPVGSDSPALGDNHLRNIQQFIVDVFGISNNTNYSAAAFSITSAGVVTVSQTGFSITDLTIARGTVTTDVRPLTMSVTWNSSSVAFAGVRLAVTDTTSSTASLLLDMTVGGTSKFTVDKTGAVTVGTWSGTTLQTTVGGTGLVAYTTGDVLAASGTNTLVAVGAAATSGRFFRNAGPSTIPDWSTNRLPNTATRGDILCANATNDFTSPLGSGASSTVLQGQGAGNVPSWTATPTVTTISATNGSFTTLKVTSSTIAAGAGSQGVLLTTGTSGPANTTASAWGRITYAGSEYYIPLWN